eukprot:CAMPEP_0119307156 /NCGR_PEP_ID=MMETSP1333-20130426/7731_1 /TAXON_ID=418940 /ORGANISM="Scyphosphaera apsteinii, Strain RCC1455" /LENGTH=79 /DNA_ID=CAMNT_0007310633 /DNA_START=44 /DNA_END=283 /DNA_ORIENTATION=+
MTANKGTIHVFHAIVRGDRASPFIPAWLRGGQWALVHRDGLHHGLQHMRRQSAAPSSSQTSSGEASGITASTIQQLAQV